MHRSNARYQKRHRPKLPSRVLEAFIRKVEEFKLLPEEELWKKFNSEKMSNTYRTALISAIEYVKRAKEEQANLKPSAEDSTDTE